MSGGAGSLRALPAALTAFIRRAEAVNPVFPLGLIVGAASAVTAIYVLRISQYFVMTDELAYMKQAVTIGRDLLPLTPGDLWFTSWAQLEPLLAAPAYALFDTPTAFDTVHVLNGVVMASAAIPAYLLARELALSRLWAYAVAALTVAVPWAALSATLLTEVAAYPAFTWAALAIQRAVAVPSPRRDLLAIAAIGLAGAARLQLAVLGLAFAAAAVMHELAYLARAEGDAERRRDRLRAALAAHWPLAAAAVVAAVAAAVFGRSDLLGSYGIAVTGDLLPSGAIGVAGDVLAYVAIGVGVIPLAVAAAWAAATLFRPMSRERHAFACVLVAVVAVMVLTVGSFTARFAPAIHDRYLFYLVPLFFVGMVALLVERRPLTLPLVLAGAAGAWLVTTVSIVPAGANVISPSATFHAVLEGRAYDVGRLVGDPALSTTTLVAGATAAATVAIAAARRWLPQLPVAVAVTVATLAFCAAETGYAMREIAESQRGPSPEFLESRGWIDRALPDGARAAAVLSVVDSPSTTALSWWDAAFWNSKLDTLAAAEPSQTYGQAYWRPFELDPATGEIRGLDDHDHLVMAASDMRFALKGETAVAERNRLEVLQAPRPYAADWALLGGGEAGGLKVGVPARIRVYGHDGDESRVLTLHIENLEVAEQPLGYSARAAGVRRRGELDPGESADVAVPLRVPAGGYAEIDLMARNLDGDETGDAALWLMGVR